LGCALQLQMKTGHSGFKGTERPHAGHLIASIM
jgi:hypothetical protein